MYTAQIRWLSDNDWPPVLDILRACGRDAADDLVRLRHFLSAPTNGGLVAVLGRRVVGVLLFEADPSRRALRIRCLAVLPAHRRRGIGSRLLHALTGKVDAVADVQVVTRVRETNLAGQLFLRANHFKAVRVLPLTEADDTEDAYLFRYEPRAACGLAPAR